MKFDLQVDLDFKFKFHFQGSIGLLHWHPWTADIRLLLVLGNVPKLMLVNFQGSILAWKYQ
jgi:hypothetical protein